MANKRSYKVKRSYKNKKKQAKRRHKNKSSKKQIGGGGRKFLATLLPAIVGSTYIGLKLASNRKNQ